jgi:hypothetical protein
MVVLVAITFFFSVLLILLVAGIIDFFNWSHAQNQIVPPVSPSWNIFKKLLYKNENY